MSNIEVGCKVTISATYLSIQNKWLREKWGGKQVTVMRLYRDRADVQLPGSPEELSVPVDHLKRGDSQ